MVVSAGFTNPITLPYSSRTPTRARTPAHDKPCHKGNPWASAELSREGAIAQAESAPLSAMPLFYLSLISVKMQQLGKISSKIFGHFTPTKPSIGSSPLNIQLSINQ
jgi:hypothetical protein